jgi:hypothetical protein
VKRLRSIGLCSSILIAVVGPAVAQVRCEIAAGTSAWSLPSGPWGGARVWTASQRHSTNGLAIQQKGSYKFLVRMQDRSLIGWIHKRDLHGQCPISRDFAPQTTKD